MEEGCGKKNQADGGGKGGRGQGAGEKHALTYLKWLTFAVGDKEERNSSKCMRIQSLSAQIKSQSSLQAARTCEGG